MVAQTLENLDAIGVTENIGSFTADAGYFSEENVTSLEANERINAAYIATGRLVTSKIPEELSQGPPAERPDNEGEDGPQAADEEGPRGIRSPESDRGTAVRPIARCRGFRQFLLRPTHC